MKADQSNPQRNALGGGVSEEELLKAISSSGYPMQSLAVDALVRGLSGDDSICQVQEEWSFVDEESGTTRQLDALVMDEITPRRNDEDVDVEGISGTPVGFLRHHIDLLVECKYSELPYLFFLRESDIGQVPRLLGLPHQEVGFREEQEIESYLKVPLYEILDVRGSSFCQDPPTAISMSKLHRKGKGLELSGEEAYRGLTLPMSKALRHYSKLLEYRTERLYFDLRLVFPLIVLDAPMVGVHMNSGNIGLEALPWIRLVRAEPGDGNATGPHNYTSVVSFDVVHVDFLDQYIARVRELGSHLSTRLDRIAIQVLSGESLLPTNPSDEDFQYDGLQASMSEDKFMEMTREKSRRIHAALWRSDEG